MRPRTNRCEFFATEKAISVKCREADRALSSTKPNRCAVVNGPDELDRRGLEGRQGAVKPRRGRCSDLPDLTDIHCNDAYSALLFVWRS